jgi:phage terminase large subunit-like protein
LAKRQEHIRQARHDVNSFIEYIFDRPDGRPVSQGWMHRQWHAIADKSPRTVIVGPRGHGKTTQMLGRAMHELGNDPNHIVKLLCQADAKSVKRLASVRDHMKSNDRLHAVFPHMDMGRALEWNKHQVTIPRTIRSTEPSIEALGITSSASGDRATLLIADDVVDRRNSITLPKVREATRAAWDDWVNLLIRGRIIYICPLWHHRDLTHDLLANPEWSVAWYEITDSLGSYVKLPDGTRYNGTQPLWGVEEMCPRHGAPAARSRMGHCRCGPWTLDRLTQRRRELGTTKFARGFSNRPMEAGELRIHPDWIHYWEVPPGNDWLTLIGIDLASSQGAGNDWTGICLVKVNPVTGHQRVTEARHYQLRFPEKIALVKRLYADHRPEGFVIELAAGGRELAEHLVAKTSIPVMPVKTRPGAGKAARLDRVTPLLQNGQIQFSPMLDPEGAEVNDVVGNLVKELLTFPVAAHEDIMDAFVHVSNYAQLLYPGEMDETEPIGDDEDDEAADVDDAYSFVALY